MQLTKVALSSFHSSCACRGEDAAADPAGYVHRAPAAGGAGRGATAHPLLQDAGRAGATLGAERERRQWPRKQGHPVQEAW